MSSFNYNLDLLKTYTREDLERLSGDERRIVQHLFNNEEWLQVDKSDAARRSFEELGFGGDLSEAELRRFVQGIDSIVTGRADGVITDEEAAKWTADNVRAGSHVQGQFGADAAAVISTLQTLFNGEATTAPTPAPDSTTPDVGETATPRGRFVAEDRSEAQETVDNLRGRVERDSDLTDDQFNEFIPLLDGIDELIEEGLISNEEVGELADLLEDLRLNDTLSEEEKTEFLALLRESVEFLADPNISPADRRDLMNAIFSRNANEIRAVLSEIQGNDDGGRRVEDTDDNNEPRRGEFLPPGPEPEPEPEYDPFAFDRIEHKGGNVYEAILDE